MAVTKGEGPARRTPWGHRMLVLRKGAGGMEPQCSQPASDIVPDLTGRDTDDSEVRTA